MTSDRDKATIFRDLHGAGCFVLANAWDLGSARLLAALGAEALATSSAAYAFTRGLPDGAHVGREEALAHAAEMNAATALPVSADLEDGYGPAPETVAETVTMAAEAGLAGCSIEDIDLAAEDGSAYPVDHARARITAAVTAAREAETRLGRPFTLTARADGVLTGAYDLEQAIGRLQAFEAAGADVLYAPGLPDLAALGRLCESVSKPVNALAAGPLLKGDVAAIAAAGARRISLGSVLARKTHAVIRDSAAALFGPGAFEPMRGGAAGAAIDALLAQGAAGARQNR